jgi:hypothetical protein
LAPKTAPPMTEKGYVNPYGGWLSGWAVQGDPFETIPELLWPNSVRVYTRMGREDSRLASMFQAIWLPVRRTGWRVDPNGAKVAVTKFIAANLGLPIVGDDENKPTPRTKSQFSWSEHLRTALSYVQFGHSVFELVYRRDGSMVLLDKVAPRPQSTIAFWNVDQKGDLLSIQQWPAGIFAMPGFVVQAPTSVGANAIPGANLVAYVRDPDPGVWTGNSILRACYKNFLLKDELMRIEAAAARRHGIGVPVAWATPEESEDKERIAEYQATASAYRGGSSAGLGLPAEAKFQIVGPTGTPMDPRRAIEYHDHQMALVALAHFLNLDGDGGSYALANVQQDTFIQALQTVADTIRDTAQRRIIEPLVDANWGPDEPMPKLVFDEIGSRQDATAASLNQLAVSGLITPDDRLESYIRQSSGLPSPDPATARPDQPALPAMPDQSAQPDQVQPPEPATQTRPAAARARQRRENPQGKQQPLF